MRPLCWVEPDNAELWEIEDAFLVGDCLLVAPILESGAEQRKIRLPEGEWINFYDDKLFLGGKWVEVTASLERIPILVRAGSILPVDQVDTLALHIYPPPQGENAKGKMFTDMGDGYGDWRVDQFELMRMDNDQFRFDWNSLGNFPLPYQQVRLCFHNFPRQSVVVDQQDKLLMDGCLVPTR